MTSTRLSLPSPRHAWRLLAVLLPIVSAPEPVLQRGFPQSAAGTMNRPGNAGRSGG